MTLNPPTEHQLLVFWVGLLLILVTARVMGALMQRIGQPAVVGELAAGLILGPSLLGRVAPDVTDWLFPADDVQTAMLFTVGWLGVLFLLVATGFETDLGLIRRLGRAATLVSAGSLIVPAAAGLAVGWFIPTAFVGGDTERCIFALFIAAALSISSLPVIAKILSEMGLMRRNFGQLTLAAGMANDVIGWIGLGFIAGLAQAGGVKLDKLAFTVDRRHRLLRPRLHRGPTAGRRVAPPGAGQRRQRPVRAHRRPGHRAVVRRDHAVAPRRGRARRLRRRGDPRSVTASPTTSSSDRSRR